jgi:pimeloyl-ACP methyl ester carboxylesterase
MFTLLCDNCGLEARCDARRLFSVDQAINDIGKEDVDMDAIMTARPVEIPPLALPGFLTAPEEGCNAIVVFAHGSGSSRLSPRNTHMARELNKAGLGTLLFDLLRLEEADDREKVFDISLLSQRLGDAVGWLQRGQATSGKPVGLFAVSTGAAAALNVAAQAMDVVGAVVSRSGRPDLSHLLPFVKAPTLLIVGERDAPVIEINKVALAELNCAKKLEIIPGATHLFEEAETLDAALEAAKAWFVRHLTGAGTVVR